MAQGTVSIQPMTPVRSALVRYDALLPANFLEKEDAEASVVVITETEAIIAVMQPVCMPGDARRRTTSEVLPKAVSQSGRLS